jgi:hypothetical protein
MSLRGRRRSDNPFLSPEEAARLRYDPVRFAAIFWPGFKFYNKQRDIMESLVWNDETFVPAGNMLGKDFVAGFIALWFFLTRHPCRVVTTSADYSQLESVLWGEIRRFLQEAGAPVDYRKGGCLVINHLHIRKIVNNKQCGLSYLIGRVAAKGEGMLGHHLPWGPLWNGMKTPHTLFLADEASGVEDITYERADTWAHRKLVIGNPYPCTNFFKKGIKGGDVAAKADLHLDPENRSITPAIQADLDRLNSMV